MDDVTKFQNDAHAIERSNQVLAAAKAVMPGSHHYSLAAALFAASMRAVEEVDGSIGAAAFIKEALEAVAASSAAATH